MWTSDAASNSINGSFHSAAVGNVTPAYEGQKGAPYSVEEKANQGGDPPDLWYVGNQIKNRAGSKFSKDLFENY